MGRLGVVLGSSGLGPGGETLAAAAAELGAAIVQRHGTRARYQLPHRIDHAANLRTLIDAGCDRVLALGSVGSLHAELAVGSFVCPDDFIAPHLGISSLEDERAHAAAGFDRAWRSEVVSAWRGHEPGLRDGGVYWQTVGPRLETAAEIRLIASHATVVGMTIAAECIVAGELGLAYAAVCIVDNLANGIGPGSLTLAAINANRRVSGERLQAALAAVLPILGTAG